MRRLTSPFLPSLLILTLLVAPGCRRSRRKVQTVEEDSGPLASVVTLADQRTAMQLVRGFHGLEQGAWRWTMGKFTVTLKPPAGAAQKGARLEVKLTVPEAVLQKIQTTTLSVTVNGLALEPETYTKPGEYTYARDVASSALTGEAAAFDFSLDKYLAAGSVEQRELGVIATSFGLIAK